MAHSDDLVQLPTEQSLADTARLAVDLARAAKSANTRRAYAADWARFTEWCRVKRLDPLPADPVTVGLFIADLSAGRGGLAPSTLDRMVTGICAQHRAKGLLLDRRHPAIAHVLQGLKRTKRAQKRRAAPLVQADLGLVLDALGDDLRSLRDRALLLLGWSAALRRSELVAIDVAHLTDTRDGILLFLPASKTDQEGEGATLGIPFAKKKGRCPVRAIKAWLDAADIDDGPIFRRINKWGAVERDRLTDGSVARILKKRGKIAGLPAAQLERTSGHSLRAGFITTAYDKEVPEQATQRHARHKSADTTRSYNRVASAFKQNAAKAIFDADR